MKQDRTHDNLNYKQRLIAKVEAGKATEKRGGVSTHCDIDDILYLVSLN